MNPISFACSHCSQRITVPPETAGRAVPCPNCKQATLAPMALSATPVGAQAAYRDQGPDFSETLRRARESTDSIFNDQDDEGDSLFGGGESSRKPILPATSPASKTPTVSADAHQATMRVPGLPNLPPIRSDSPPAATRATFVPHAVSTPSNPFEDLVVGEDLEDSGGLRAEGAIEEEDNEAPPPQSFPLKNVLIVALTLYGVCMTIVAIWGWVRTPSVKAAQAPIVNKR